MISDDDDVNGLFFPLNFPSRMLRIYGNVDLRGFVSYFFPSPFASVCSYSMVFSPNGLLSLFGRFLLLTFNTPFLLRLLRNLLVVSVPPVVEFHLL